MKFKNLSWIKVILFAVITGLYTGIICLIPAIRDTSFHDIAVTYEWWVLFAIIIIMGCEKIWEASLKTFVFFLISQPLVYLVQAIFTEQGFGIFRYYKYWGVITLLTIPGAAIAFFVKKKNILSAVILSVATGLVANIGVTYLYSCVFGFPWHLLTVIFCFGLVVWLILKLLPGKRERIIAFAITAVVLLVTVFVTFIKRPESNFSYPLDSQMAGHELTADIEDPDLIRVEFTDESIVVYASKQGETIVTVRDDAGNTKKYSVSVGKGNYTVITEIE